MKPGGSISRMIESEVTVLPEPDSPTMPRLAPGASAKLTPSTARTMPARVRKCVCRSSTSSSGGSCRLALHPHLAALHHQARTRRAARDRRADCRARRARRRSCPAAACRRVSAIPHTRAAKPVAAVIASSADMPPCCISSSSSGMPSIGVKRQPASVPATQVDARLAHAPELLEIVVEHAQPAIAAIALLGRRCERSHAPRRCLQHEAADRERAGDRNAGARHLLGDRRARIPACPSRSTRKPACSMPSNPASTTQLGRLRAEAMRGDACGRARCASSASAASSAGLYDGSQDMVLTVPPPLAITLMKSAPSFAISRTLRRSAVLAIGLAAEIPGVAAGDGDRLAAGDDARAVPVPELQRAAQRRTPCRARRRHRARW